jgi:hypothetical protein
MDAKKLGLEVKRKFPGLSAKEINMMIIRGKKANKGTLTGLTIRGGKNIFLSVNLAL